MSSSAAMLYSCTNEILQNLWTENIANNIAKANLAYIQQSFNLAKTFLFFSNFSNKQISFDSCTRSGWKIEISNVRVKIYHHKSKFHLMKFIFERVEHAISHFECNK